MVKDRIRVIFFDIGGVLLSNGWGHESRQKAAEHFDFDYTEMNHRHEFIFNVYEIGEISLDEYLETVLFYQPRSFTPEAVKSFMFLESEKLAHTFEWLLQWKSRSSSKIKLFSLNNEGRELNDYRISHFGLSKLFDGFISSCEVRMRKPDPGIFRLALGIVHADPSECLYFDDRIILVEAAKKLGIRGFQHTSFESTKKIIESFS